MIRGNTNKKRSCEPSEQWLDNKISVPSTPGPETRTKLKEARTPFSGEDCNNDEQERNPPRIQAPDPEGTTSTGREESQEQTNKVGEPEDTIQRPPIPSNENTQTDEKDKEKNEPLEKLFGSKPPEKVVIHNDYPDQIITIRGETYPFECDQETYPLNADPGL
ncbi:hypothetical protein Tco_1024235 [Tanacetum coccineum]